MSKNYYNLSQDHNFKIAYESKFVKCINILFNKAINDFECFMFDVLNGIFYI